MKIHCSAQRLLNPFRGVINTIRHQSAEAVTMDGIHWDIYVRNADLVKDLDNPNNVQTSEIRYGKWSQKTGLKRGPLHPSDEFKRLENLGAIVFEHLLKVHDQLPFPFHDQYEYWLLDKNKQPLAILNSAETKQDIDFNESSQWRAGLACKKYFNSLAIKRLTNEASRSTKSADYLEGYINSLAGKTPTAQWYYRQADGSGVCVCNDNQADSSPSMPKVLSLQHFPNLLISVSGHDQVHSEMLKEFFSWQAPWLLLLNLDTDTRKLFEFNARKRALEVYRNYLLYPEIINQNHINAACVEAVLRGDQITDQSKENVMSTFYIELQSTTME